MPKKKGQTKRDARSTAASTATRGSVAAPDRSSTGGASKRKRGGQPRNRNAALLDAKIAKQTERQSVLRSAAREARKLASGDENARQRRISRRFRDREYEIRMLTRQVEVRGRFNVKGELKRPYEKLLSLIREDIDDLRTERREEDTGTVRLVDLISASMTADAAPENKASKGSPSRAEKSPPRPAEAAPTATELEARTLRVRR